MHQIILRNAENYNDKSEGEYIVTFLTHGHKSSQFLWVFFLWCETSDRPEILEVVVCV